MQIALDRTILSGIKKQPESIKPMERLPPERLHGQGLDPQQEESGNRAIVALLSDPEVCDQVDLVLTYRNGAYEVWSRRGMIRFERVVSNGRLYFPLIECIGANPIANQDHTAIATCADELRAAAASGHPTEDPNRAFIEPSQVSYPSAYERIAQIFDSPFTGDLVVSPKCFTFGLQPGQHGALDVVQSRAPLAFAGPGVRPGRYDTEARHVDIAPTICHLMRFSLVDGRDCTGRTSSERGVAPDVYLKRQDGRVLTEITLDPRVEEAAVPRLVYFILYDGLSNSELRELLERNDPIIRNLRRILDHSAFFTFGSTVTFPSITWPSHSTIFTGAWSGHHDIVNPAYYDRARRQPLLPQAQVMMTERFLGSGVETLYEAFKRVLGPDAFTVSIHEPQSRGADHAALERRVIGPRDRLRALTAELLEDVHPRYLAEGKEAVHREAIVDARGLAQLLVLLDDTSHPFPVLIAHEFALIDGAGHDYGPHGEGLRTAIGETDVRLGKVLDALAAKGVLDSTLFVFTADHGMAAQDVSLRANPVRHLERTGMKTVTGEPMIWLRDLHVEVEPAADGRTARVTVFDNDPDESGEKPPVSDAQVLARTTAGEVLARARTNDLGIAAFATPPDVTPHDILIAVQHPAYNARHLRLDGTSLAVDPRTLYR